MKSEREIANSRYYIICHTNRNVQRSKWIIDEFYIRIECSSVGCMHIVFGVFPSPITLERAIFSTQLFSGICFFFSCTIYVRLFLTFLHFHYCFRCNWSIKRLQSNRNEVQQKKNTSNNNRMLRYWCDTFINDTDRSFAVIPYRKHVWCVCVCELWHKQKQDNAIFVFRRTEKKNCRRRIEWQQ